MGGLDEVKKDQLLAALVMLYLLFVCIAIYYGTK